MLRRAALPAILALCVSACATLDGPGADSVPRTVTGTDQAMQEFLSGRELDPVEGAWEHDQSSFEFVITRNNFAVAPDYDYVGVMTLPESSTWHQGDIKLLLQKTQDAGVYDGIWVTGNKAKRRMKFVVEHENLIQASFVSNDGNAYFLRIRRVNPRLAGSF